MTSAVFGLTVYDPGKADANAAFQKVDFTNGVVTATQLNIRQGPSETHDVVRVLNQGHEVKVFGKIGDWYTIYDPKSGTVGAAHGNYIKSNEIAQNDSTPSEQQDKVQAQQTSPSQNKNSGTPSNSSPSINSTNSPASTTTNAALLSEISKEEQELLNLINKAREEAGVRPLVLNKDLLKTTELKAKDMIEKDYFAHQSPVFGSPFDMMRQNNISFKCAGENIAGNQSVEKAFNAWMSSSDHRANILNANFTETGISIQNGSQYGKIFVQQFIGN